MDDMREAGPPSEGKELTRGSIQELLGDSLCVSCEKNAEKVQQTIVSFVQQETTSHTKQLRNDAKQLLLKLKEYRKQIVMLKKANEKLKKGVSNGEPKERHQEQEEDTRKEVTGLQEQVKSQVAENNRLSQALEEVKMALQVNAEALDSSSKALMAREEEVGSYKASLKIAQSEISSFEQSAEELKHKMERAQVLETEQQVLVLTNNGLISTNQKLEDTIISLKNTIEEQNEHISTLSDQQPSSESPDERPQRKELVTTPQASGPGDVSGEPLMSATDVQDLAALKTQNAVLLNTMLHSALSSTLEPSEKPALLSLKATSDVVSIDPTQPKEDVLLKSLLDKTIESVSYQQSCSALESKLLAANKKTVQLARRYKACKKEMGDLKSSETSVAEENRETKRAREALEEEVSQLRKAHSEQSSTITLKQQQFEEASSLHHLLKQKERELHELIRKKETEITDLSAALDESNEKLAIASEKQKAETSPPPGFHLSKHVLTTIAVRDTLFLCVDVSVRNADMRYQWITKETGFNWHHTVQGPEGELNAGSLQSLLPSTIDQQLRTQFADEISALKETKEKTAASLRAVENELVQYKLKAQAAIKKSRQEGSSETRLELARKQEIVIELESELAMVLKRCEQLKSEKDGLANKLAKADADLSTALQSSKASEERLKASSNTHENRLASVLRKHEEDLQEAKAAQEQERLNHAAELQHVSTDLKVAKDLNVALEKTLDISKEQYVNSNDSVLRLDQKVKEFEQEREQLITETNKLKFRCESLEEELKTVRAYSSSRKVSLDKADTTSIVSASGLSDPPFLSEVDHSRQMLRRSSQMSYTSQGSYMKASNESTTGAMPFLFDSLKKQHDSDRKRWQSEKLIYVKEMEKLEASLADVEQSRRELIGQAEQQQLSRERQEEMGNDKNKGDALLYLKNVILQYLLAKELSERQTIIPVLSTMLKFTEDEEEKAIKSLTSTKQKQEASWFKTVTFS